MNSIINNYFLSKDDFEGLEEILHSAFHGIHVKESQKYQVFYNKDTQTYIAIFSAKDIPFSQCCKMPIYIQISIEIGIKVM